MVISHSQRSGGRTDERTNAVADLKPWREVGWIFKDGEVVAIERHEDETRIRKVDD